MTPENDPKDEAGVGGGVLLTGKRGQLCVVLNLHFKKTVVILANIYGAPSRH